MRLTDGLDDGAVLERDRELAQIASCLAAAHSGDGCVLVVEGPAGIGKSRLLRAARGVAQLDGALWLTATGSPLERGFPFGVALQLLDRTVATADREARRQAFAGPAELAAPVFGITDLGQPARPGAADDAAVRHGLYWLVANLAEQETVVLVVDDAQWADLTSLRWLSYLARRIDDHRALMIVAVRTSEPDAPIEQLATLAAGAREVLRPAALSADAVGQLMRARLDREPASGLVESCHRITGGNPFYLGELLRSLSAEEIGAAEVAERPDWAPARVRSAVLARLRAMPAPTHELASALSVLGDGAQLQHLASLAGLDVDQAVTAAQSLTEADLVRDEPTLSFVHPIVRGAVYGELPAVRRAQLHGQAASLLMAHGASDAVAALHLLEAHPTGDPVAFNVLERAAAQARARGAGDNAALLLRRALTEPPPADRRAGALLELAEIEDELADAGTIEHHEQAIALLDDSAMVVRATVSMSRALFRVGRFDDALRELRSILDGPASDDHELALEVEAAALFVEMLTGTGRADLMDRLRGLAARSRGATRAECAVLANVALRLTMVGGPIDEILRASRAVVAHRDLLSQDPNWLFTSLNTLCFADALEESAHHYALEIAEAVRTGVARTYSLASAFGAAPALRLGRVADSAALAQSALDLPDSDGRLAEPFAAAVLACALLERGDLEGAERALASAGTGGARPGPPMMFTPLRDARGRLLLARHRYAEALDEFLACGEAQLATGITNPALIAWRSGAGAAAAQLGDHERARSLVEEEVRLARAFGAPRAIGIALCAAGTIEGIADSGATALDLLGEAVEVLTPSPARLEYAKAVIELGSAQRRAGQRALAREQLRVGLDVAVRCGAVRAAERAREEIAASGGRLRREPLSGVESLTPSEHRIAQLAARGLTNRQIAQELFLSKKTVEMHMGRVFRKLDVRSRAQLEGLMPAAAI
jgi:DNA-binding CsgD family transcriptional regulator